MSSGHISIRNVCVAQYWVIKRAKAQTVFVFGDESLLWGVVCWCALQILASSSSFFQIHLVQDWLLIFYRLSTQFVASGSHADGGNNPGKTSWSFRCPFLSFQSLKEKNRREMSRSCPDLSRGDRKILWPHRIRGQFCFRPAPPFLSFQCWRTNSRSNIMIMSEFTQKWHENSTVTSNYGPVFLFIRLAHYCFSFHSWSKYSQRNAMFKSELIMYWSGRKIMSWWFQTNIGLEGLNPH